MPRALLLVAVVLLTGALGVALRRSASLLRADRILNTAEASTRAAQARGGVSVALLRHNASALGRAEELAPGSAAVRLARGSQFLLWGQADAAAASYEEALRLEPRAEIYLNLGRAQLLLGRHEEARESFARAVQLDPDLGREVPPIAEPPAAP